MLCNIYQNGKKVDSLKVYEKDGAFYLGYDWDMYIHRIHGWSDVMNWIDSNSGTVYYDDWDEALEDYADPWDSWDDVLTVDKIKNYVDDSQVAEACEGKIEFVDEDEE